MTFLRLNKSVILINVNRLNSPIKSIFNLTYKARPIYTPYKRAHLKQNDSEKVKIKSRPRHSRQMEKIRKQG